MIQISFEATPGIEPGIRVLQTRALPLGHVAKDDPKQIRTAVTAVKGRCLNRLTMGPDGNAGPVMRNAVSR